jgi:hypothetical protein
VLLTRAGDDAERSALSERYPEMPLSVEKRTIVPATHQPPSDIVSVRLGGGGQGV